MMLSGGRSIEGNRYVGEQRSDRARIAGGASCTRRTSRRSAPRSISARPRSRTGSRCSPATSSPSLDRRRTRRTSCSSSTTTTPSAFSLDMIPTFAIGCAEEFTPADEGWGPRPVPTVHRPPGIRRAHRAVADPGRFRPHHRQQDGRRPRTDRAAVADVRPARRWPCRVIPFAVNVVLYPPPSGMRCYRLGQALRQAIESTTSPSRCRSGAPAA